MCIYITNKWKRIASIALVPVVAINTYMVGRAIARRDHSATKGGPTYSISNQEDFEELSSITEPIQLEDSELESIPRNEGNSIETTKNTIQEESEINNLYKKLHTIFLSTGKSVDKIIEEGKREDEEYASALYEKLKLAGISDETIEEELDNILRFSLTFTDLDFVTWYRLFGNMLSTISMDENVMDYYYPLARYKHMATCNEKHEQSFCDYERITCPILEELNKQTMQEMSFGTYVINEVANSDDPELMKSLERILKSDAVFDIALYELDAVYTLSQNPTCLSDETWEFLFKNLLLTVDERENVCEVYAKLARFVHQLTCEFDHYEDEYGRHICEGLKLVYKG